MRTATRTRPATIEYLHEQGHDVPADLTIAYDYDAQQWVEQDHGHLQEDGTVLYCRVRWEHCTDNARR